MKFALLTLLAFSFFGCEISNNTDFFGYNQDPVARATGARWWWEPSTHFDAGVDIFRYRNTNVAYDGGTTDLRMAFDISNNPVQVGGASVNGALLPWIPTEHGIFHANIYAKADDSTSFGSLDSAVFSYVNFDGESWREKIEVAPDFGDITSEDTVSMSAGWTIHYQHPVPGDSIQVMITPIFADPARAKKLPVDSIMSLHEWLPDTGTIIIHRINYHTPLVSIRMFCKSIDSILPSAHRQMASASEYIQI